MNQNHQGIGALSNKAVVFGVLIVGVLIALGLLASCEHQKPSKKAKKSVEQTAPVPTPAALTLDQIRSALDAAPTAHYEIDAIQVGVSPSAKKKLFFSGAQPDEKAPISFSFFVLKGGGKIILVDTGFYSEEKIKLWKIENYRDPVKSLDAIGIQPAQVTDVIVTHRHWDHIGGVGKFPNTALWIPEGEFKSALKGYREKDPGLISDLEKITSANRVHFTKPIENPLPGILLVGQGSHTRYFQYVIVKGESGFLILSSDVGPLYENFTGPTISGQSANRDDSLAALTNMLAVTGGKTDRIIPSHDPEVFKKFPQVAPGIVRIEPSEPPKPEKK